MNAVTTDSRLSPPLKPWYREPWPWLLMSGPAIVIVAGIATAIVAFSGADGLVADDYYKQGLHVNRQIARDQAAFELGIGGEVMLLPGRVRVTLRSTGPLPDRFTLRLAHPSRASEDRVLYPARMPDGAWEAPLQGLPASQWRVIVETEKWRVAAQINTKNAAGAALTPGVR